ncbi:UDP-N-acetylmuramyl pentapeptide phosphotransferase/UDP-N-acetylglucosamine-1-phosphate transferase [Spirosomataceae bacterium TFI 002]|nr:UDP-N-acetylmuramyl pentapeptide phosphotransferase/UDP-N-acetylglucosamine-1-phosphate transferase [Spirosomataceae bacterium TFI 002]
MVYIGLAIFLLLTEFFYLRIATKYGIVDKPNERSSHKKVTIRGMGIIFVIATLSYSIYNSFSLPYFTLGFILISTISFIDDIRPLQNRYRIVAQFISVGLIFLEFTQQGHSILFLYIPILMIISVGIINAYNFMDGINGITGAYSLLTILTLAYIHHFSSPFIDLDLLIFTGISLIIFLFFNFRKKAIGFCGDVGSVSIAFIIIYCIGVLILTTNQWKYIFLLSIYGIDTIYTLIYRLSKRENIFKAHKVHFFQILVHKYKWSHLQVSILFVLLQLIVNLSVISFNADQILMYLPIFVILGFVHYFRKKKSVSIF